MKKAGVGVKVDKERLAALFYADDIVLLAECGKDLQILMDLVAEHMHKYRLQINQGKSAVVVYGPGPVERRDFTMGRLVIPRKEEYKYLGIIIQKASWSKSKESMLRKATKAMGWSWNLLMRLGAPSVKAMISVWTTLIRPHLEYGAEIWPGESNSSWKEAEALQRAMARRILCCRSNIPAEVLRGELGWPLLENRRSLLRMGLWEKILKAKKDSWLRRVYESSRQQCAANLLIYNWCSQTRIELLRLGLGKCWDDQAVPAECN